MEQDKRIGDFNSFILLLHTLLHPLAVIEICVWYNVFNEILTIVTSLGNVVEFIKAKYLMRKSAKVAVIPVRRSFFAGKTNIKWKTYAGTIGSMF